MAHTNEYLIKQLSKVELIDINKPLISDTGTMADFAKCSPHVFLDSDNVVNVSCEHGDNAGDYYGEFTGGDPRINSDIQAVADKAGFYIEWINPGHFAFFPE